MTLLFWGNVLPYIVKGRIFARIIEKGAGEFL